MFTQSEEFYDAIYHFKDYREEAERLHALIQTHIRRPARTLLDVACGTGQHLTYLRTIMRTVCGIVEAGEADGLPAS